MHQPGSSPTYRHRTLDLTQPRRIGEHGEQIVAIQVLVIGQDLIYRHAGAHELQQRLHGIAKTPNDRLPVTDPRVDGDALEFVAHLVLSHILVCCLNQTTYTILTGLPWSSESISRPIFERGSYMREIRSLWSACEPIQNHTTVSPSLMPNAL